MARDRQATEKKILHAVGNLLAREGLQFTLKDLLVVLVVVPLMVGLSESSLPLSVPALLTLTRLVIPVARSRCWSPPRCSPSSTTAPSPSEWPNTRSQWPA